MAPCSESTGMSSAPGVWRALCTTGPAAISDSLLASANRLPASRAARVTGSPAKPDDGVHHRVRRAWRLRRGRRSLDNSRVPSGRPARDGVGRVGVADDHYRRAVLAGLLERGRSTELCAPSATTRNSSGLRSTTSRVWVPIDPVEPRTATSTKRRCRLVQDAQQVVRGRQDRTTVRRSGRAPRRGRAGATPCP